VTGRLIISGRKTESTIGQVVGGQDGAAGCRDVLEAGDFRTPEQVQDWPREDPRHLVLHVTSR